MAGGNVWGVEELQAFLRTSAGRGRTVLRIAPFTVTIHPHDALRYLNYAIPDDGAQPDAPAIEALRAAFRRRHRLPRLEWIEEAAPAVAEALAASGMVEELRTPLMACTAEQLVQARAAFAAGARLCVLSPGDETALRVYARAGFRRAATMLYWSDPA